MADMSTIDRLLAGFRSFRTHYYERRPQLFETLQQGQKPEVMVIACSDSRVDPAILTQSEPGELFVVRNVANIVPPFKPDGLHHGTSAALEFAVRDLGVSHIIILGHSQCGGIQGLVRGLGEEGSKRDFIEPWMSVVAGACAHHVAAGKDDTGHRNLREVEQASIRISTANLMTYPWIREKVERKELGLYGWWFELDAGKLWTVRAGSEKAARLS
jgi:carbonic anhydrase